MAMAGASFSSILPSSQFKPNSSSPSLRITCGPRDNRGPLVRGRTLSTEAILAVQTLKRASVSDDADSVDRAVSSTLPRLLKADLAAALSELQRQNLCSLALKVFDEMRKRGGKLGAADFAAYAGMVSALTRNGLTTEIDDLVADLIKEGLDDDFRGYAKLMKALIAAGKGKAVWEVYKGFKEKGFVGDEYSFLVTSKGLRRLGEREAAAEVDADYEAWCEQRGRIMVS